MVKIKRECGTNILRITLSELKCGRIKIITIIRGNKMVENVMKE